MVWGLEIQGFMTKVLRLEGLEFKASGVCLFLSLVAWLLRCFNCR